jgi:hypothetical protein
MLAFETKPLGFVTLGESLFEPLQLRSSSADADSSISST